MIVMATTRPRKPALAKGAQDEFRVLSPEDGRLLFDAQVRQRLDISGEEFLRRWNAGDYDAPFEDPEQHSTLVHLWMLSSLAR
jgi:hypothetical protein